VRPTSNNITDNHVTANVKVVWVSLYISMQASWHQHQIHMLWKMT